MNGGGNDQVMRALLKAAALPSRPHEDVGKHLSGYGSDGHILSEISTMWKDKCHVFHSWKLRELLSKRKRVEERTPDTREEKGVTEVKNRYGNKVIQKLWV